MIAGIGGDTLRKNPIRRRGAVYPGITDARFGYAMFEHHGAGWDITVHDIDGSVHRHCRLEHRTLSCTAALS